MRLCAAMAAALFSCTMILSPLPAQEIEDLVSKYTSDNGEGYLQPLADAFGADLNSGIFQSARIGKSRLYIRGDLVAMMAPISDDNKTFTARTQPPFSPDTTATAPTVAGDPEPVSVTGTGGTEFVFPGGLAIQRLPFLVPQLAVGGFAGTEVMFRYFQITPSDNIGKVKLFGFGVRHNVSQYLEDPPLDLALGFMVQSFDVGSIIDANTTYFGLEASYERGIVTLYGGPGYERSRLDIAYDFDPETLVRFDMKGDNAFRFTTGAAVDLRIIHFFIDYNFASQSALSLGLGFGSMI